MSKHNIKTENPDSVKEVDKGSDRYSLNKKSRMINTYGKARIINSKKTSQFTGSLSDRLQLIDTTPTGEDPYQLGEADMREQSPIPKLMLQKTNHGRMKICTDTSGETTTSSMRIYNSNAREGNSKSLMNKIKLGRYNLTNTYVHPSELKSDSPKTLIVDEPDLDIVKTEPDIDWPMYNTNKSGNETSLCDFSYGETPNNLATHMLPSLDSMEFQELFSTNPSLNLDTLATDEYSATSRKTATEKSKKRTGRTTSLVGQNFMGVSIIPWLLILTALRKSRLAKHFFRWRYACKLVYYNAVP